MALSSSNTAISSYGLSCQGEPRGALKQRLSCVFQAADECRGILSQVVSAVENQIRNFPTLCEGFRREIFSPTFCNIGVEYKPYPAPIVLRGNSAVVWKGEQPCMSGTSCGCRAPFSRWERS